MAELIKKIKVGSTTYDIGVDINNLEGVRSIATGTANGTINVNTNGTTANVAVKGLGSAAYTASTAYAPASHSHSYLTGWSDSRNVTTTPNDYNSQFKVVGIKTPTGSGTLDGSNYSTLVGIRGWSDSSGGNSHELAFTGSGSLYRRHGSTTSWGSWIQILDSSNYTSYCAQASHTHSYLPLSGGTVTGAIIVNNTNSSGQISLFEDGEGGTLTIKSKNGTYQYHVDAYADEYIRMHTADLNPNGAYKQISWNGKTGALTADAVYGAVWNDYAEYRDQENSLKPGYITYCDDNGKLKLTTERLQKFEGVVSDTFGFAIGETDECKTPLAVSGRVLVYVNENDEFHSGDCVCAGPDGKAYRMTREEIIQYPDRIVGVVSEIPTYETWGSGNVAVNGRIWIKVR